MFKLFLLGSMYPMYASYICLTSKIGNGNPTIVELYKDTYNWLMYWTTFSIILVIYKFTSFLPFVDLFTSYLLLHLQIDKDFRNKLLVKYIIPVIKKYKYKLFTYVRMSDIITYLMLLYVKYKVMNPATPDEASSSVVSNVIVERKSTASPEMY